MMMSSIGNLPHLALCACLEQYREQVVLVSEPLDVSEISTFDQLLLSTVSFQKI
jgi:hypothetical protein